MNRAVTECLLILSCTLPLFGQSIAVTINASQTEVKAGSPVGVTIHLTNLSNHEVNRGGGCYSDGLDLGYTYTCQDSVTKRILKNKKVSDLLTCGDRDMVKPGESFEQQIVISGACEMDKPGRYLVQVGRVDPDDPSHSRLVKSNKIEIIVKP